MTIYQRGLEPGEDGTHRFVLSWCHSGKRRKQTVLGDVFSAVARADEINAEITSGDAGPTKMQLREVVEAFVADMVKRADAGDLAPATPIRYRSALRHLVGYAESIAVDPRESLTREFVLGFKQHLLGSLVAPNGHPKAARRPLKQAGIAFILAATSALIRWGVGAGLLCKGSLRAIPHCRVRRETKPLQAPVPITVQQVRQLLAAAVSPSELLTVMLLAQHGLRPSEAAWLMAERIDFEGRWITYAGIEELGYRTKGSVERRLPITDDLREVLLAVLGDRRTGPVLLRSSSPDRVISLAGMAAQVQSRNCTRWSDRAAAGVCVLRTAGGVDADWIRSLFRRLAKRAGLPVRLTPKSLRHLFATLLEQADVGYYTRRYMLGHATQNRRRQDATAVYTHVSDLAIQSGHASVTMFLIEPRCEIESVECRFPQ